MALCGFVIEALGWEGAFYVTGGASFVWCLIWYICMYENPEEHPRISREELNYIVESKKSSDDKTEACPTVSSSTSVPWLSLARSFPMWAIIVCEAGNSFGFSLYFSYLPTYIENIIGVPISQNGLLSALPFLSRYLGGVFFATSGECLLARRMVSVLGVRRFFSAIAMFGPAATLLAVAYAGCDPILAFFLLCLGFFLNGSITIGLFANKADLSLNFAGTVAGLGNTSANVISFVVPLVVGAITNNRQTIEAWQQVFWTCVPVYVACEVFYLVFASGSRQHWDLAKMRDREEETQEEKKEEDSDTDEDVKVCVASPNVL